MKLCHLIAGLALAASSSVFASRAPAPTVDAHKDDLAVQRITLEKEMKPGERFAEINANDRAQVFATLDRMQALLAGRSVSQLNETEKVQLLNDQELVNALLTKARVDSRMQCKREKKVGSHRVTSTCRTVAEWRRASQQSREDMELRRSMGDILPDREPKGFRHGGPGS